jgi:protein SCO1/2
VSKRLSRVILPLFLCAFAAAWTLGGNAAAVAEDAPRAPGGRFMLMDQYGETVTDADFHGKLLLMYFGYTYCPDICPTSLQTIADAMDLLGDDAERVQPVFITVDPERDTVPILGDYVANFHPSIIALWGPPRMIADVAKKYKVRYEKVREPGAGPDEYLVDHSGGVLLMGPDGRFLKKFLHGTPAEKMAAEIRRFLPDRR